MSSNMPSEYAPPVPSDSLILLAKIRKRLTQRDLAARLQVDPKTIARWERRETDCPVLVGPALREILLSGIRPDAGPSKFTFIDLFAGIGGMREGFRSAGG